ncbi:MAG TPA: hypothetical protein VGE11_18515 [Pseudonocardia sp.]
MTSSTDGRSVRQVAVPPTARARTTLARVDYADAFLVDAASTRDRTGEQWARLILEGAPAKTRRDLGRGWSALGLRLRPVGSDRTVLGWEIRDSTPDVALLGARGRLGIAGELLFERQPGGMLFATFVQLTNPVARVFWMALVAARHRTIVRGLLARGAAA